MPPIRATKRSRAVGGKTDKKRDAGVIEEK
jgi:hypothetical protein